MINMNIVILGMHRSGTSLITGILNKAGFFIGYQDELIGSNAENPLGFFERKDIRKINDEFLFSNNADWFQISSIINNEVSEESKNIYKEKLLIILNSRLKPKNFVIKEPRFCLTYNYIKDIVGEHKVLFVYRNPLDVAYSLFSRNKFPIEYGLGLWEAYNTLSLNSLKDGDVKYEIIN